MAANLGDLSYSEKRLALEALGAQTRVWRAGNSPRYDITLSVPSEVNIVD